MLTVASSAGEVLPPSTEDVQEAYARFLTGFVRKLEVAGAPARPTVERQAQVDVFARRMRLRACDGRTDTWQDPFAPTDSEPPVVFHCTWENGERISLTRSANTGAWAVSDDATAAAGAGVLLVGPKVDAPKIVAVTVVPTAPTVVDPVADLVKPAAPTGALPARVDATATLRAMPSPYVPPQRFEQAVAAPAPAPVPVRTGAMPAPYATR